MEIKRKSRMAAGIPLVSENYVLGMVGRMVGTRLGDSVMKGVVQGSSIKEVSQTRIDDSMREENVYEYDM